MISLRYHVVSLAAVFLALAVGLVLGAGGVSDRLLGAMATKADGLTGQVQQLTAQRDALAAAQRADDEFARRVAPAAVRGVLQGQSVALVTSGADGPTRDALVELLRQAGATVTGTVALTAGGHRPGAGRPAPPAHRHAAARGRAAARRGRHRQPARRPAGRRPHRAERAGAGHRPAGGRRAQRPQRGGLHRCGTGARARGPRARAHRRRVTGLDAGDGAAVVTRMAAQLDHAGRGAVLAGCAGSADATGAVGVARADPTVTAALSTVDNVETGAGQISTVLALREQVDGRAGRYGTAASAADGAAPRT